MGVPVPTRIVRENITNRFLVFDIPVDVSLADLTNEITNSNDASVLELSRFVKKNIQVEFSPVLIICLGTYLPLELKIWFTIKHIQQFVNRLRQCSKSMLVNARNQCSSMLEINARQCSLFNHVSSKCQNNQLCVNCGTQHERVCTLPVSCPNCKGEHRADYNHCPFRTQEAEFLSYKCKNFLSFIDARR